MKVVVLDQDIPKKQKHGPIFCKLEEKVAGKSLYYIIMNIEYLNIQLIFPQKKNTKLLNFHYK